MKALVIQHKIEHKEKHLKWENLQYREVKDENPNGDLQITKTNSLAVSKNVDQIVFHILILNQEWFFLQSQKLEGGCIDRRSVV